MKVRALRGVCIGPGRHIHPDGPEREADLDAGTVSFLKNIGAVEEVIDPSRESPATTVAVTKEDEQTVQAEAEAEHRATKSHQQKHKEK